MPRIAFGVSGLLIALTRLPVGLALVVIGVGVLAMGVAVSPTIERGWLCVVCATEARWSSSVGTIWDVSCAVVGITTPLDLPVASVGLLEWWP